MGLIIVSAWVSDAFSFTAAINGINMYPFHNINKSQDKSYEQTSSHINIWAVLDDR